MKININNVKVIKNRRSHNCSRCSLILQMFCLLCCLQKGGVFMPDPNRLVLDGTNLPWQLFSEVVAWKESVPPNLTVFLEFPYLEVSLILKTCKHQLFCFRPPHPFEERMRSIRFAPPPGRRLRRCSRTKSPDKTHQGSDMPNILAATAPCVPGTVGEGYLPPLVRVQGPFRPPEELRRLKSRPPNPTLRVATFYDCVTLKRQVHHWIH